MHTPNIHKRVSLPDPMLTFWLTVVESRSQPMISTIDTQWVSGSVNIIAVELFFSSTYHPST